MNENTIIDPKQILAILNSLGIAGITATELKIFIKELKLYTKAKEDCLQWKNETKLKFLNKQNPENRGLTNNMTINVTKCIIPLNDDEQKCTKINSKKHYNKVFKNDVICNLSVIKKGVSTKTSSILPMGSPQLNLQSAQFKEIVPENILMNKISVQKYHKFKGKNDGENIHRAQNTIHIEQNKYQRLQSRFKSLNNLPNVSSKLKAPLLNKNINDPVILYKKYKDFWTHLSLPGEEAHKSLRWAIRQKMLYSYPTPRI